MKCKICGSNFEPRIPSWAEKVPGTPVDPAQFNKLSFSTGSDKLLVALECCSSCTGKLIHRSYDDNFGERVASFLKALMAVEIIPSSTPDAPVAVEGTDLVIEEMEDEEEEEDEEEDPAEIFLEPPSFDDLEEKTERSSYRPKMSALEELEALGDGEVMTEELYRRVVAETTP